MTQLPGRFIRSIVNRWRAFQFNQDFDRISRKVNTPEFLKLRDKWVPTAIGYTKYFKIESTIEFSLRRVRRLDLHKCQPARILDLGCGFGMFALAARHFGHECDGLDMDDANDPNTTMFREVFHTLNGRDRISHRIVGFEPLPVPDGSYDLTTAFQICFTNFNRPDAWGVKEWSYLLKDLKRILAPGGRVLLHFSKPEGSDLYRPPVVEEMFRELGAELDGPYACFQNLSKMDVQQVRALGT